jgi:DNA-binding response OmpR family regulator
MTNPIGTGKKALVLEDEPAMGEFFGILLEKEGFKVKIAEDGNKGLAEIDSFEPDVILTDLMMPGLGGYEFIREMQAKGGGAIPVIVVTARMVDDTTSDMIRAEPNVIELLQKPVPHHRLLNALSRAFPTT